MSGGRSGVAGGEHVGEVLQGGSVLLGVEGHLADVVVDDVAAVGEQEHAGAGEFGPNDSPTTPSVVSASAAAASSSMFVGGSTPAASSMSTL